MDYGYDDLINAINNHEIQEVKFCVKNYAHYKDCKISVVKECLPNKNIIYLIVVNLVKDETECVSFYNKFNEKYKIFNMGKKGSYTLKQLWNSIEIFNVSKF